MLITAGGQITAIMTLPRHIDWRPQDDITALELAELMPVLLALNHSKCTYSNETVIRALPDHLRRHFEILEAS